MEHRGSIVRKRVDQQGKGIKELAAAFNTNRQTVYRWFDQENLDVDRVIAIGEVIKWDFSEDFPELRAFLPQPDNIVSDLPQGYESAPSPRNSTEAAKMVEKAHQKYVELMAIYTRLVVKESMSA